MPGFKSVPLGTRRKRGMNMEVYIRGLKETQRKMEQVLRDMKGGGTMAEQMRKAALLVSRDGKKNAPVKTGRLRASITPDVRVIKGGGIMGVVGSNVYYAPFQEFGTSRMPGKFYLRRAVIDNQDRIMALLHRAVVMIVAK